MVESQNRLSEGKEGRQRVEREWKDREGREEHLSVLWKSIEESSESASPGQRLCHLIGYVEQFILFFPTPRAGAEGGAAERRNAVGRESARDVGEPPSTCRLPSAHTSTPFSNIASSGRQLSRSRRSSPSAFPGFHLASSRSSALVSPSPGRERERNGTRERHEKKGMRKEAAGAAMVRESALRSFAAERG